MNKKSKIYIVGGGIASLSAAVYLIKDGGVDGGQIKIFDEAKRMGGSLDAQNLSDSDGYVMRGVRMFEEQAFSCTFDLLSAIPSLTAPGKTLREEFVEFNKVNKSYSKSRLLIDGEAIDSRPLKLSLGDRLKLAGLLFKSESSLEDVAIRDYFSDPFFTSNFWYEFCTVFAFEPWHSAIEFRRYFKRFIQSFPNIDTLETIEISPHNQYESMVLPIMDWLKKRGVEFIPNTKITDLKFIPDQDKKRVSRINYERDGENGAITVAKNDYVFVTLGSIISNTSLGSMTKPSLLNLTEKSGAWKLWENIAKNNPEFGRPSVFNSNVEKSRWTSFTITFRDPLFFNLIEKFVHKKVTSFGGVNLIDSNWLMSAVITYKPYFINQPKEINLCWGFGLRSEEKGNFVKKKMSECTGVEILTELIHHLGFEEHLGAIIEKAVCIPCTTPYITSHFLPRKISDRPLVVPKSSANFAFLGQYCEIPNDVVFTVEYSVRSAQTAVYSLLGLNKKVPPIYQGMHHAKVLFNALKTICR